MWAPPVLARIFLLLVTAAPFLFSETDYFRQALDLYRAQQFEPALAAARQAIRQQPDNPAYCHVLGLTLQANLQMVPAEESLRKAVALGPKQSAYQADLGALLHQQRRYVEALPFLKRAVELDGNNLQARMMLARTYVFSYQQLRIPNFVELILEQLNFIVAKDPRFPAVHHHLALVYINSGEPAKAVEELTTELKHFPGNTQARLELGETLLKLNQYHRAAAELATVAAQAPGMAPVQFSLAKAYKYDGQNAKALDAAQRCVALDANFADAHYLLAQLYRDAGKPDLARTHLETFRRLKPGNSVQ